MAKVFDVCDRFDAGRIIVHARDVVGNFEKILNNVVRNLREICKIR